MDIKNKALLLNADTILCAISSCFVERLHEQVGTIQAIKDGENPSIALDKNAIHDVEEQLLFFKDYPLYFLSVVFQSVADYLVVNNRLLLEACSKHEEI